MGVNYLTENAWKTFLKKYQGKLKDNGIQPYVRAYEKAPKEKFDERQKALDKIFQLGLALANKKEVKAIPEAHDYISEMLAIIPKIGEEMDAAKKAAKVSETDKELMRNGLIDAANMVATNAKANALLFGQQVIFACEAFEKYSKNRIEDLEDRITAEDLFAPLIAAATGGIGGMLEKAVEDQVGKIVVAEINKVALDKFNKRLSGAGSGSDAKDLERAVGSLTAAARDTATAITGIILKEIIPRCDKVVSTLNAHRPIEGSLDNFIVPFYKQTASGIDQALDDQFGIPTPTRSKAAQAKIYGELVARFEEKVILANKSGVEGMKIKITGDTSEAKYQAGARAKQAVKQREAEMGSKAKEMGM